MRSDDERLKGCSQEPKRSANAKKEKECLCSRSRNFFDHGRFRTHMLIRRNVVAERHGAGVSASVFADGDVPGYIVTGILAFIFGVSFTLLCSRIKKSGEEKKHGGTGR